MTLPDVCDVCNLRPTETCANGCNIIQDSRRGVVPVSMTTAADFHAAHHAPGERTDENSRLPTLSHACTQVRVSADLQGGGALRQLAGSASLFAVGDVSGC